MCGIVGFFGEPLADTQELGFPAGVEQPAENIPSGQQIDDQLFEHAKAAAASAAQPTFVESVAPSLVEDPQLARLPEYEVQAPSTDRVAELPIDGRRTPTRSSTTMSPGENGTAASAYASLAPLPSFPGFAPSTRRSPSDLLAAVGHAAVPILPVLLLLSVADPQSVALSLTAFAVGIPLFARRRTSHAPNCMSADIRPWSAAALGTATALVAVLASDLWLPWMDVPTLGLLAAGGAVFAVSAAFEETGAKKPHSRRRLLVVGAAHGGADLPTELDNHPTFACAGIVCDECADCASANGLVLGPMAELSHIMVDERPDLVVVADPAARERAASELLRLAPLNYRTVDLPEFYEHSFGRVPLGHVSPAWFMSLRDINRRPYSIVTKRILDLTFALSGLLLVAPLLPLVALLVRRSGPGPIIYRQVRVGQGGKLFETLKFRTMTDAAEAPGQALWAKTHDVRVTPIGRFLRTTRLDELPQLWNVLRGDMSFVGPRPERPEFRELLERENPFWMQRHLVKPGITGWAQVQMGYTSDVAGAMKKLSYDLYYVKHCSLALDVRIAVKTVRVVLSGSGAR